MTITSATSAAPLTTSFAARMTGLMPRGLRQEADAMSFEAFRDEYAFSSGPLRLGNWRCTDDERPSTRLGPYPRHYEATLAMGEDRKSTRLNSSHPSISYAVFCLKKKKKKRETAISTSRQRRPNRMPDERQRAL